MTVDLARLRALHAAALAAPNGDAGLRAAVRWGRAIDRHAPALFAELETLRAASTPQPTITEVVARPKDLRSAISWLTALVHRGFTYSGLTVPEARALLDELEALRERAAKLIAQRDWQTAELERVRAMVEDKS